MIASTLDCTVAKKGCLLFSPTNQFHSIRCTYSHNNARVLQLCHDALQLESHFAFLSKLHGVIHIFCVKDWEKYICDSALSSKVSFYLLCLQKTEIETTMYWSCYFYRRILLESGAQAISMHALWKVLRFLPESDEPRSSAWRKDHLSAVWKNWIH